MSLNAATAAPSGHFLVSRKKPSVIAQTHLISVSLKKVLTKPKSYFIINHVVTDAEIAQLVEHNLAKVGVASSSLVFRSM